MGEMQTELTEHKLQINEQKRELQLLKVKQTISILSKQTKYLVKMLPWERLWLGCLTIFQLYRGG
jgi:hypothetical protein